jgi:hypothetical protein
MSQAGKGDTFRPVNLTQYNQNYDRIFRCLKSTAEQRDAEANENGVICSEQKATKLVEDSSSQVEQTLQM